VVVTARRREENLQDIPLSIQAISAEAMQVQGIYTMEDITDYVPNVTLMVTGRAGLGSVIIRGIGGGSPDPSALSGSGMYLDGHYMPGRQSGFMNTTDIERVEVLRGPQGTLFGKNTTGGLVNIITAKPRPEFEANALLRAAEHGQQDVRGMVNLPITNNTFARLAVGSEQMDGYYYNTHFNTDAGATDHTSLNAALRTTPGNWTLDFAYNRQEHDDHNSPGGCFNSDPPAPQWGGGIGNLNRVYDGYQDDFRAACPASSPEESKFVTSQDQLGYSKLEMDSAFAVAQWNSDGALGGLEDASAKFQASWQYVDWEYNQGQENTFYPQSARGHVPGAMGHDTTTRGFEAVFEGTVNDRLEFTVGVNYFWELHKIGDGRCRALFIASGATDIDPDDPTIETPDGGLLPRPAGGDPSAGVDCNDDISGLVVAPLLGGSELYPGPNPFIIQMRGEYESLGVFGHLTYALNDNWDFDLGARWTEDDREFWNFENAIGNCHPNPADQQAELGVIAMPPDALCAGPFTYEPTFESAIWNGFFNEVEGTWDEITPMVSLTRNLQAGDTLESGMIYFLYSEGFLSGGFNTEINTRLPAVQGSDLLTYGPESVSNYEIGFKGTLLDGRLRLSADIFYMDYQDKQEGIGLPNDGGVFGPDEGSPLDIIRSIADVEISGVELELRANPWDGGFISVDLGMMSNEYSDFSYPDPLDPSIIVDESASFIGDRIPDWTLTVAVEHEFALGNGGSLTPRMQVYTQDSYDYDASTIGAPPSTFCNQDTYAKVNARLTYVPPAGNWQASLFGNNITDEDVIKSCGDSRGVWNTWYQRPAWWGLEFTMDWGAN
jgi:outer membrane receptor protein involved in Fe transport